MTSRDFCYWLQGLFELGNPESLTPEQIQTIRNHLNMVFYHEIDPSFGGPEVQDALNRLHSGVQVEESPSNLTQSPQRPYLGPPYLDPKAKC